MSKIDINYIAELYTSGVSVDTICEKLGIGRTTVYRHLKRFGVDVPKTRRIQFSKSELENIKSLYLDGIGYEGIARRLGYSGGAIKRALTDMGIKIRNRSEQQFARMKRSSPEQIANLTKAAHKAATGRKKTTREKELAAITREKNLTSVSYLELEFAKLFSNVGYSFTQQKAAGVYNCDFVIDSVAVEIWGGNWHFTGEHAARTPERVKYLIDSGLSVIIVPVNVSNVFGDGLHKELVRNIDELRLNPPPVGEYRMIWRNGELVTTGGRDCDLESFKPPFTHRSNPVTGRYETVFK